MLKKTFFLMSLLFLCGAAAFAQKSSLRVATYNIRYDNVSDTVNAWGKRLPVLADQIRFQEFDIFGTQEVLLHQLQGMAKALTGYKHIGVGRDDGKEKGEFAAVFYRADKFDLLKQGNFWLSETPDKPGKGWDADFPRVCTWGQFKAKDTGLSFYFFNVHFDHMGEQARRESVKLMLQKIKQIAGTAPAIFVGDFNFSQKDEKYTTLSTSGLLQDAYQLADVRFAPRGTFNGFEATRKTDERIDHIWLTSGFKVSRYGILTSTYSNGKFPSDHFPVMAEVVYEK
ncbi:endonuclease/exonuclease/phosphatase family protein [Pontibacter sp. E15-1]|uniref:endonuclease/exonuclease/phosphatase family protein n=1 Tax=Pontibacter sp. E15-1 TaxID=2919918 RepID=UPI001F4FDCA2|nr:endonuclease/exonuclease/phosphatase family protein [Pontibacter sp. E15-1]MCJ8164484.1 endonuclease/exonuclease/phosphatase family protein [Pontibacter sp. E15-1]